MGENEKNYLDWEGLLEYHEKLETKLSEKANTEDLADVATSGDYNDLDNTPTNVSLFTNDAGYIASEIDNTNGHDYVEIGGIKWATMNIGAENITDIGLYFQWGDILGYTSEEVGEEKNFTWEDYKFNPSGDGTTFNKYNSTDLKTSLDTEDDAAANAWGSDWRVPTISELQTLSNAVNVSWTNDYEDSGVPGLILTDKEDSSKVLFLPATGVCNDGSIIDDNTTGFYWSKSLGNTDDKGLGLGFDKTNGTTWEYSNSRSLGFAIRPVLEGPAKRIIMGVTQAEKDSWNSKVSGVQVGESGEVISPINGIVIIPNQSNVQADWNQNDSSADDFIKNKPGIGVANGLATLDSSGKVPSSQLPSYVDDVIEGYYHDSKFYEHYTTIPGDDAAQTNWGEGWRMPTTAEFEAFGSAVNTEWTYDYNSTGVAGMICTDKTDSSKVLFFPAAGYCYNGSVYGVGSNGHYWSSSLYSDNMTYGRYLYFNNGLVKWQLRNNRYNGVSVRPVLASGDSTRPYVEIGGIKWATMNIGASSVIDAGLYFQWGDTLGYTASQAGTDKVFNWANYKYCDGTGSVMTKYNSTDGLTTLIVGSAELYTDEITPELGKIYLDISTNLSYRWSGSTYVVISSPYVLPTASANTLGGVKVGNGLSIDNNGVLSALGQEVEIGTTSPVNDVKLFVDEDDDPAVSLDVYTRAQVDAKVTGTVHLSAQTLTEAQKAQARTNIGAISQVQLDTLTRHTRLTDFDLSVLKQAVADGNLEKYGLKPGDQKTINGYTYVIAGLNPMKGSVTPYRLTTNHVGLIVIPHTTQAWNVSGNTYTGADGRGAGYANSDLHYYLKNTVLPHVQNDLGSANLLSHYKLLTIDVNTSGYNKFGSASGCSSNWDWFNEYIAALSEVQVYGGTVWSSSGYDTGEACRQLEVFQKYSHTEIFGGEYPWLRDVVSASRAARCYGTGDANYDAASDPGSVAGLILFN